MSRKSSSTSGPLALLRRIRRRVARRWWGCKEYVAFFKALADAPAAEDAARGEDVVFRAATPADVPWMAAHLAAWASWCRGGRPVSGAEPVLAEQFAGDDITVVGAEAKPGGALVYVAWLCRGDFAFGLLGDAAEPGRDASLRRVWVPPDRRRTGIATRGWLFAEAEARRRGLRGVWSFVQAGNQPSLALHRGMGYQQRGGVRILTRLGRRYGGARLDSAEAWGMKRIPFSVSGL